MPVSWTIPEGLRVLPDGSWRVGDQPIGHARTLSYLKAHLVFDEAGAAIADGGRRMAITVEGPPLEVVRLVLDADRGTLTARLDDGTEEVVGSGGIGMDEKTGRFELAARLGRTRAVLSRAAHQTLLAHLGEEGGVFFIELGSQRIPIRTGSE